MVSSIVVLLTTFSSHAYQNHDKQQVKVVDVLAVEYPPFTTSQVAGNGIAMSAFYQRFNEPQIKWRPQFVPPARAYYLIEKGDWCVSFYPIPDNILSTKITLSEQVIRIGLIRLKSEKQKSSVFEWQTLTELSPASVAILRTGVNSVFIQRFQQANLKPVFVENVTSARYMLQYGRVDYAMLDNVSFENLPELEQQNIEFSLSSLIETPITVFVNPKCQLNLEISEDTQSNK